MPAQKSDIERAAARKEKSISAFQANKEEGMKIMSSGRDATLIVTAKLHHLNMSEDEIKADIKKWSKWMYDSIYNAPFF